MESFLSFIFLKLFFLICFFQTCCADSPFFDCVHCQFESPPDYTREIASLFLANFFAENGSIVLNKVSTFKVK